MPDLYRTLVKPVVTEKSSAVYQESSSRARPMYTFQVEPRASKQEIRQAIEALFEVTVTDIRTMNVRAKLRTRGRTFGRRPKWKKAIVTLKEGDTIDVFEG